MQPELWLFGLLTAVSRLIRLHAVARKSTFVVTTLARAYHPSVAPRAIDGSDTRNPDDLPSYQVQSPVRRLTGEDLAPSSPAEGTNLVPRLFDPASMAIAYCRKPIVWYGQSRMLLLHAVHFSRGANGRSHIRRSSRTCRNLRRSHGTRHSHGRS
jgi:hypothetical protein